LHAAAKFAHKLLSALDLFTRTAQVPVGVSVSLWKCPAIPTSEMLFSRT